MKVYSILYVVSFLTVIKSDEKNEILDELKILKTEKYFNELSFRITEKEIKLAISQLKTKKASGLDSISNELIKASYVN